jgi:hypothetical protein
MPRATWMACSPRQARCLTSRSGRWRPAPVTEIAGQWTPLTPRAGEDGTVTADFDVGVRLVPGRVPIAGRGPELEDGWLAYGTLVSVSRRLRWDSEPR